MLPALLLLGVGGLGIYKYLSKKKFILLDGVEMAGKTTLSKLLLGENVGNQYEVTHSFFVKKGKNYVVYDVPGQEGEKANSDREKALKKVEQKKDEVLYIYVFDATKKLENDEYEKNVLSML